MSFNNGQNERRRSDIEGSTKVEGDVREKLERALRHSFPHNFFFLAASSTPFVTSAFDRAGVSSERRKPALAPSVCQDMLAVLPHLH